MDKAVNDALEYIANRLSKAARGIEPETDFGDTVATLAAALRKLRGPVPHDLDVEETLVALGMKPGDAHDVRFVYRTLSFLKTSAGLF